MDVVSGNVLQILSYRRITEIPQTFLKGATHPRPRATASYAPGRRDDFDMFYRPAVDHCRPLSTRGSSAIGSNYGFHRKPNSTRADGSSAAANPTQSASAARRQPRRPNTLSDARFPSTMYAKQAYADCARSLVAWPTRCEAMPRRRHSGST